MDQTSLRCLLRVLPDSSKEQITALIESGGEEFHNTVTEIIANIIFFPFGKTLTPPQQAIVKVIVTEHIEVFKQLCENSGKKKKIRRQLIVENSAIIADLLYELRNPIVKHLYKCIEEEEPDDEFDDDEESMTESEEGDKEIEDE